jgi:hypothetical protein
VRWPAASIVPGMETERISVMQELANMPLRIVFSRLVAATVSPFVRRWFCCREK